MSYLVVAMWYVEGADGYSEIRGQGWVDIPERYVRKVGENLLPFNFEGPSSSAMRNVCLRSTQVHEKKSLPSASPMLLIHLSYHRQTTDCHLGSHPCYMPLLPFHEQ